MNPKINELVNMFFVDLERDSRSANEKNLNSWLWFSCDASLRNEVGLSIRGDARWLNRWGGPREGAGRKPTGRKRQQFYVTDEENEKLRAYLEELRK